MFVKDRIIEMFERNKGVFLSGEDIAGQLGVSRGAVWKAVKSMKEDGYCIDAVTNRGYRLRESTDVLSVVGVEKYLDDNKIALEVYKTVESTNTVARRRLSNGMHEEVIVVAGEQTGGRGRLGRSFFSPSDSGLYISLLLMPELSMNDVVKITTCAAVAVCEALEVFSGDKAEIKWVNDVFMRGKKVCGILTEASMSMESQGCECAVVGIGINLYEPKGGFPEELKDIAGAVLENTVDDARNRIAAEVINRFMSYYRGLGENTYVGEYRRRSMVIGKEINVISGEKITPATALAIDDDCHLLVRYADGHEELLSSGEISIRLR